VSGAGSADSTWQANELARLRSEVHRLIKGQVLARVLADELDIASRASWQAMRGIHGACGLVTCMSLLSQVGHAQPMLWQPTLELASLLLAPGGILVLYDTDKWGGFADEQVMTPFAANLGLELVAKEEPIAYRGEAAEDGRFFAMVFRRASSDLRRS
jgi:hypothetical protein